MTMNKPCQHVDFQSWCGVCRLSVTSAKYRRAWGGGISTTKPHMSVQEMADKRRRCGQAKAEGRPCTEFNNVQVATMATPTPKTTGIKWAVAVTTVSQRRSTLLPPTLASIKAAGFPDPRLCVDGTGDGFDHFGLEVTYRRQQIRTHGNWVLAAMELFIREPHAARYGIFQDDFAVYRNTRQYLDACPYPTFGYWNLTTFDARPGSSNEKVVEGQPVGWYEAAELMAPKGYQAGRGAVALVFNREALLTLLSSRHMVERPMDAHRGHQAVDGGVVWAMNKAGWREYVHNPSLVCHTGGDASTMGHGRYKLPLTWRGDDFDALSLLPSTSTIMPSGISDTAPTPAATDH